MSACLLLLHLAGFVHGARGLAQNRRVRDIPRGYGARIEQLLRPHDEIVRIVEEDGDGIMFNEAPSAEELITYLVSNSDVIATIEVARVSGILVDDGTWIHTQVTGTVREVLKDQNRPLRPGSTFRFQMAGGETTIGRVRVMTSPEAPHLSVGPIYVVFGEVVSDNGIMFPLDGYPLQKLLAEIRRLLT